VGISRQSSGWSPLLAPGTEEAPSSRSSCTGRGPGHLFDAADLQLITALDGPAGFPEAIETVFPKAQVKLCIVHMVRGLAQLCTRTPGGATLERSAEQALTAREARWDVRLPMISRKWWTHWVNLTPFLDDRPEIRKVWGSDRGSCSEISPGP